MLPPRARGADAAEAEELAISGDLGRPGAGRPPAVPGALTGVVATPPVLGPASILRDFEESMRYYPEFMEQLPVLTWYGAARLVPDRRHRVPCHDLPQRRCVSPSAAACPTAPLMHPRAIPSDALERPYTAGGGGVPPLDPPPSSSDV